jgi:excisionase family DNA binding protein
MAVMEALMSSQELAELFDVPPRTLDQWAYNRSGPPFIKVGRHRRYRPSDVAAWLEARTVGVGGGAADATT